MGLIRKLASIMMLSGMSSHRDEGTTLHIQQWLVGTAVALSIVAAAEIRKAVLRRSAAKPPCGPESLPLNARVPDKAGYAQMPTWACTRPEATASASAVWSRSVWSV
jgi:hypothetical protein